MATAGLSFAKPQADKAQHGRGHANGHASHDETSASTQASHGHSGANGKAGPAKAGGSSGGGGSSPWAPNGNNGTVKVDGQPFDTSHGNEPHPGCVFRINFFNYDDGTVHATYEFDLHPPSGSGTLMSGSQDFTGGKGYDASTGAVDLSSALASAGASANKNQGFHVALTVHASGSIGSDVKHKVFWVSDCSQQASTTTSPGGPGGGSAPTSAAAARSGSSQRAGRPGAARPARSVSGSPAFTG